VALTLAPATQAETAEALREASREGRRLRPRGGGTRSRRGPPAPADEAVLSTAGLRRVVDHQPADLTVTAEAGLPALELAELVGGAGQRWPQAELRPGSTVGGVLAAAASGRLRLRHGPVRDSLLEVVVATGDGRLVTGGGRTVKGVAGYDLPRLMVGSLGSLGVIVQATLKLWPEPPAQGWFGAEGPIESRLELAARLLRDVHRPAAVLLGPGWLAVCLEGPPEDVAPPDGTAPAEAPPPLAARGLVQVGVAPPDLPGLARSLEARGTPFEAQLGVGACVAGVETADEVAAVRALAADLGGHAVVVDGPDDLRVDPWGPTPPGLEVMRRVKAAFDPAGVLLVGALPGGL